MERSATAEAAGSLHGFPAAPTSFVGRGREVDEIAGQLGQYRLAPLTLNPADPDGSEAVALFADRARRADASFALDGDTAPLVARLVARLDGMPLAIELLDERGRRVFRALSAFPGPFTLEGAAVAGAGSGPAVLHLVDCSLLVPPRAGPDGRFRYVMLETLRAYGAGLLAEAGEGDTGLHSPMARVCDHTLTTVLIEVGDLAAAERTCATGLADSRDTGDLWSLGNLLEKIVVLDLNAGRFADAAAHLREALQTALRTGVRRKVLEDLDCCGYLCAWTGRPAEAITPAQEGQNDPCR